ncbi:TPA: dihydrodipicolinate synthase family protein, partial [Streptococcus suis]|nr:dihydrodipicolinate synthase family protein [Streptococcus suis]
MKDLSKYHGIIPAFYACYDEAGEISSEGVKALVQYFIDKGVQGLYVNGSSGECIYQSVADRKQILEAVMEVAKGKLTIINHVACNNLKDSVELARHSEELGVDAIAAIPPIYFRLPEYSIAAYWNGISAAAPNTDFIIYNIPQLAGVSLTPSLYKEMLKNPRVVGVKNSSMPVQDIDTFVTLGGEDYVVFNGPDEQFLGGRLMGAKGGIGGTYGAMPE